ncbi:unnamed protein product [Fusarium graminearum]|nr:unnamed protein product [Fusarium graminearum]
MTSLLTGSAVLVTGGNRRGNDNYGFGYSCLETTDRRQDEKNLSIGYNREPLFLPRFFHSDSDTLVERALDGAKNDEKIAFIEVSKDGHRFADFFDLQAHVSHSRGDDFVGKYPLGDALCFRQRQKMQPQSQSVEGWMKQMDELCRYAKDNIRINGVSESLHRTRQVKQRFLKRSAQSLTGSDLSVQIPKKVSEVTLQYKICRSSHKSWKISTKLGFLTDTAAQGSAQPTEQTVVDTVL